MAIFREQDWEQLPDDSILLEQRSFDSVNGICAVALTCWRKGEDPMTAQNRLRVYSPGELKRMAVEAGFAEVDFYGDPEGGPSPATAVSSFLEGRPRNNAEAANTC